MKNPCLYPNKILEHTISSLLDPYVLKDGIKLSEVLSFLPAGIINKTETGIGATTLELNSARNSIIVEPIKVTASLKAYGRTKKLQSLPNPNFDNPACLYVGSETPEFLKKITANDIRDYHLTPGYKKFVVVADSLHKVIKAIGEDVYTDYFLMIDEADSFQLDSTYRDSMNICLDYFKKFPETNRALVTATMLEFSDPEINRLTKTLIQYETPASYDITLVHTDQLWGTAVDIITDLISSCKNEKILIAYNSPDGCLNIANHLDKTNVVRPGEQKILCSVKSKVKVKPYFSQLDSDMLPAKVNYITSAYFSGFDLHERFHLISISDASSFVTALSEHKLKQIAGRGRLGLLSQTVIYKTKAYSEPTYTKEQFLDAGKREVQALQCMELQYQHNPVLKENISKLRELLLSSQDGAMRFARFDIENNACVAYLNIDAKLEADRVRKNLYSSPIQLKKALTEKGNRVQMIEKKSKTDVVDQNGKAAGLINEIEEIIDRARNISNRSELQELAREFSWSTRQKEILRTLTEYRSYVDWDRLLVLVKENANSRDSRKLKNLEAKLFITTYSENTDYKRILFKHFSLGSSYTADQQKDLWNEFFQETNISIRVASNDRATKLTSLHFKVVWKGKPKRPVLLSEDTLGITVLKKRTNDPKTLQELIDMLF